MTLFNVEKSLGKARWATKDIKLDDIERAARAHDLPEIIVRLLLGRGIGHDQIPAFINPTLREHMPDPNSLAGMEEMAAYAAEAIIKNKKIAIFGDFDVDGATSSAVLYRFLKACGIESRIYIPDRLEEGYGPNVKAFQTLRDEGAELVFVLDCGITAFEVIQKGRDMGLDIIILDHHEAEDKLPAANHVINPKRKDDTSNMNMLAAVGVTFMACVAINKKLREQGFFSPPYPPASGGDRGGEPNIINLLDLVCLGTVCDMVPLTGVNRLLVRQGFAVINRLGNTGIKLLAEVAGIHAPFSTYHLGFALGPRINAGGRIHKSDLGAKLLCTDDSEEAKNIAWLLNDCNDRRREIQVQMQTEAERKVENENLHAQAAIIVADENWHPGLAGLVAGRLKDKYEKPACVITFTKNGDGTLEGRGSGRSIPGVHIAQAFIDARNAGLISKGGGHAMAGGFTIAPEQIPVFSEFINAHVQKQITAAQTNVVSDIDALVTAQGVTVEMVKLLEEGIGPFGQDFPEPLFALSNVRIHSVDIMKESHLRVMISDWEGGTRLKAVAFGAVGTPLGEAFLKQGKQAFHLLCHFKINRWQGRESAEIHIKDAAFAMEQEDKTRMAV